MTTRPLLVRGATLALFLLMSATAFPANVTVPTFELITQAAPINGVFALQTYGNIVIQIDGGYKFGAQVNLGFLNSLSPGLSLESAVQSPLALSGASVIMRDVLGSTIDLSYFVGQNDYFCMGDGFSYFGATTFATGYSGYMYFPTGPLYKGIYQVDGTGIKLEVAPIKEILRFALYAYEDTHSNDSPMMPAGTVNTLGQPLGSFSLDLRGLMNFDVIKVESFLGVTYTPTTTYGLYRTGVMLYATNKDVEFFAQIGIPEWDTSSTFTINNFYLLFEPRLHLGQFSIVPTFFWHPAYYLQFYNPAEVGNFDVNVNSYFGDLVTTAVRGGLEGNFKFQSATASAAGIIQTVVSPYASFATPGVVWTLKLNLKLFPFAASTLFGAFLGIEATL